MFSEIFDFKEILKILMQKIVSGPRGMGLKDPGPRDPGFKDPGPRGAQGLEIFILRVQIGPIDPVRA